MPWAGSSSGARLRAALLLAAGTLLAAPLPAQGEGGGGKVFLSVEEALALAFPGCEVRRETVYLTAAQRKRAAELAGTPLSSGIARPYRARKEGRLVGTAWFDTHKVRSLRESLMVAVDPNGRVTRVEVLAFAEPLDYLPRAAWYGQFTGRRLDADLDLKRGIRGVTGATLTARATTAAVRRCLALHLVLDEAGPPAAPALR